MNSLITPEILGAALIALAHDCGIQRVILPNPKPSPTARAAIVAELEGQPEPTESFDHIETPDWVLWGPSDSEVRGFELTSVFEYDGAEEQPAARHAPPHNPHKWARICS